MKKIFLFLSLALLVSCNQEELPQKQTTPIVKENSFKVGKSDIEKVVNGYLQAGNTRTTNNACMIVGIDSINAQDNTTRGIQKESNPQNLLYFVKISDGSTIVIAGDKRAEPIYAHFNNIELKFLHGKLIEQEKLPESFLFMLGTAATSVYNRMTPDAPINSHWDQPETRSSKRYEESVPQKCNVRWGQGNPFNLQSPSSNGKYASNGRAAAGCVPIAVVQALTVLKNDFGVFKGYGLKTSWSKLKTKEYGYYFTSQSEKDDISNIIKRIAENIGTSYDKDGSAGTDTKKAMKFLGDYLGGMFSYDTDWNNISNNMKNNSYGLSFLSGKKRSNGWVWKKLGIDMPSSGHCMLLDGYKIMNGQTLYYINFGWNGSANGYYLYDDKTWKEDSPKQYDLMMKVYNFHIDTDYDDF